MGIDYGAAFTFLFKDPHWFKKFGVGSLLTYTLIGSIPVLGWCIGITRDVISDKKAGLPGWTGFKDYWKTGYKFWLLNLIWLMPGIFSILILYLPLILVRWVEGSMLLVLFGGVLCAELIFLLVYSCLYIFLLPAAMGKFAAAGSLRQAINPFIALRAARRQFTFHLIVFLIFGVGLLNVLAVLAPFTLFLLVPPMLVYAEIVAAHFAGQLYRLEA